MNNFYLGLLNVVFGLLMISPDRPIIGLCMDEISIVWPFISVSLIIGVLMLMIATTAFTKLDIVTASFVAYLPATILPNVLVCLREVYDADDKYNLGSSTAY